MKSRMINRPFAVLALATLTIAGAITSVTLAAGNQIKQSFLVSSKIYINGKLISSPRIATLEGETVHISQKSDEQNFLELEMTADNANPNQAEELIFLDMKIKRVEQGHLSEAHPQLMVKNGEEGSIEIGDGSNPTFSMTVTAQKQ